MKGFFLRIPEELDRHFTEYCEGEGYKKSGLILKWIYDRLESQKSKDPIADAKAFGMDIHKLKSNLRKTPTQRLQDHARVQSFSSELRKAKLRKS
jgi:hypothetical protein